MATRAKGDGAPAQQTEAAASGEATAGAPENPRRPRKTTAARVATKTARAAKRQAKKSGKPVAAATAAAAPAQKKPATASSARTTSAAKRKAAASAKGGVLSRSIGKVRSVFSGAATRLSALVRPKNKPQG